MSHFTSLLSCTLNLQMTIRLKFGVKKSLHGACLSRLYFSDWKQQRRCGGSNDVAEWKRPQGVNGNCMACLGYLSRSLLSTAKSDTWFTPACL